MSLRPKGSNCDGMLPSNSDGWQTRTTYVPLMYELRITTHAKGHGSCMSWRSYSGWGNKVHTIHWYQLEGGWKSCRQLRPWCSGLLQGKDGFCWIFVHLQAGTRELCILHASASWEAPLRPEYVHKFFSCQHPPTGILQLIAMSLYNILRNMYVCMHATTQIDTGSGVYMQHIEKGCWIVPVTLLVLYGACMWVHDTSTKQHASPHKQDMVRQSLEHRAHKFQMKARRLNPSISSCLLST